MFAIRFMFRLGFVFGAGFVFKFWGFLGFGG